MTYTEALERDKSTPVMRPHLEDHQIRMVVSTLYNHILHDYIANANERKVLEALYRFYTESDLALISKQQLRVYQELEKASLQLSAFDKE